MIPQANRLEAFEEGIFQVLNEKKEELIKAGRTVYNLSVGTPDFKPANHIIEAVSKACQDPANYKYALRDIPELIDAVITRYKKRYGVELLSDEVMSVYGSQEGIAHVCLSLVDPGDIILVPNPGYPIFNYGALLAGADIKTYDLNADNGYLPDLDELAKTYGHKAKVMLVSYPLNPVCKCAPRSFYEKLIKFAKDNDIFIIHDNAYSDIIYDGRKGESILSLEGAKDVCVEFYSLSKSFNYTGARMSFVAGNKTAIKGFKKLRSQIDYGTFLPVQIGAVAALTGPDDMVIKQCKDYQDRRDALCGGLRSIGWHIEDSEGTMFAWAKIPAKFGDDDTAFVMELMDKSGVICTPGSSFGSLGKGYVRFALTMTVEEINCAVKSIKECGILS